MKTIVVLAIAVVCAIAVVGAVFVFGGMYQQELYNEYLEDTQNSQNSGERVNPNLPSLEILP